ncbi:MAG: ParB N-terminal domain-containing protein [Clostridiales bacterium]|nr:ParB N-terminal domain-containing protein [Clostridiales bacterium]
MQQINVTELKPHPRNNEFFDDMTGEKWSEFIESIKSRGVIEPIVITPDKIIVSGHQRVRACKELGISTIMCDVHTYDNEDQILQDLIETNVKQRGEVGGSAKKVGLRIRELERIYGIKHGGDRKSSTNNSDLISQSTVADQLGISVDTLNNYKMLAEMIPELSDLVDTGIVTKTTALAMMKNLSEDEQSELISSLDTTKRITQREVQKYIDKIRELENNPKLPPDYESTKRQLKDYKSDYQNLQSQFNTKVTELQDLRKQIDAMKATTPTEQYNQKLKDSVLLFCSKVATFIEQVGGFIWLTDKINEIPELERKGYIDSINVIKAWADTMDYNINNKMKEIR